MIYREVIKEISNKLGIPEEVVKAAYEAHWEFIRETIKELPLKEDLSEEEFGKLRTNFNIPSIGKLSCTYNRFVGVKKRFKYLEKLRNERINQQA